MPTKTTVIEKPKKVLREGLEIRKKQYEKSGWKFTAQLGSWDAEKDGYSISLKKLSDLLDELDGLQKVEEEYSDKPEVFRNHEEKRISKEEIEKIVGEEQASIYSWLSTCPPSDVNFRINIEKADARTIELVLENLPEENNKSRINILSARLRKLQKEEAAKNVQSSEKASLIEDNRLWIDSLEVQGWKFDFTPDDNGYIKAEKHFKYDEKPTVFGSWKLDELVSLLRAVTAHQSDLDNMGYGNRKDFGKPYISPEPRLTKKETSDQSPLETEQIVFIAVDNIEESPLEPQKLRRQTFTEDSLRELGSSIIHEKQIEPAVVRFNSESGKYQLVVGERRWRAIKLTGEPLVGGKPSLKCVVMELTDEQCLRVQYQENHQRQNNDPILDAFYFKHLVETENYTVTDLAERFGIDRKTARQTLLLNDLIEDVKLQVIKGILPKKHACYIASFPEGTQREIAERKFAFRDFNLEKRAVPYEQFESIVEENIARRLKDAPFDTEAENLHVTGLKCSNCTKNTLNQGELFAGQFGSDAVCLDGECFNLKTSTDRRLKQLRIAEEKAKQEEITVAEAIETVPLVTEKAVVLDQKLKSEVLTNQEIFGEKECAYSVAAVAVDGVYKNKQVWVCRNDDCEIHHPKPKTQELSESQRIGRKRDLYMKVGKEVRMKILGEAMNSFDDYTTFWQFDDLIRELLVNLLNLSIYYSEQIKVLTKHWKIPLKFDNPETISKFVDKLDKRQISQLLFLVTKATELKPHYTETPLRIDTIKKLTAEYTKLDYLLLEAETIARLAPDEFKQEAEEYLSSVRHGIIPPKKPKFWTELQEDANR